MSVVPGYRTRSVLIAPVIVRGARWGSLVIDYERIRREFSDFDRQLMNSMTNIIALAVIRHLLNEEIRKSEFEKTIILNNIRIPLWLFDGTGKLLRANSEVGKLTGIPAERLTTEVNRELVCSHLPEGVESPALETVRTGKAVQRTVEWGSRKFMVNSEPVFDSGGKPAYIVKSAVDVTELNTLLENRKISNICLETFLREEDAGKAIGSVLKLLRSHLRADRLLVIRIDTHQCRAEIYLEHAAGDIPPIYEGKSIQADPSEPWLERLSMNEPVFIPEMQSDEGKKLVGSWIGLLTSAGTHSLYAMPVALHGELWGSLVFFYHEPHSILVQERQFIENSARLVELLLQRQSALDRLTDALARTRAADAEKAMLLANEETLNQSMSAILGAQTPASAVEAVLKAVCGRLGASRISIVAYDDPAGMARHKYEYRCDQAAPSTLGIPPIPLSRCAFLLHSGEESVVIPDVRDPGEIARCGLWTEVTEAFGVRSMGISSIRLDGKIWGAFVVIYEKVPHKMTENETEFMRAGKHLMELILLRTRMRDEILDALEKARAADRAKSFFLASVSHEIRTPLNAVIGFTQLLRQGSVPQEEVENYLDSIAFSGNALLELINDVLDLSMLESGQMKFNPEPADFRQLANDMVRIFRPRAAMKHLELGLEIPPDMPAIRIDTQRVRQILFNLIGNAVKFTRTGSILLHADLRPAGENLADFTFFVRDTGIGISMADQKKLMEPFVRLSGLRGTNASNSGTGLGLSICKRLAENMGGRLWVESEPEKGSTFGITLYGVRLDGKTSSAPAPGTVSRALPAGNSFSILLVDDVVMNLKVMSAVCRKAGIADLVTAESGSAALAELEKRSFSLVMTDLWMPGMNGVELAAAIRRTVRAEKTPIIAVTADIESKENFDMALFAGVLLKPVTFDKLLEILRLVLPVK